MSKSVSYQEFCQRYELESDSQDAQCQYDDYCQHLEMFSDALEEVERQPIEEFTVTRAEYYSLEVMEARRVSCVRCRAVEMAYFANEQRYNEFLNHGAYTCYSCRNSAKQEQ